MSDFLTAFRNRANEEPRKIAYFNSDGERIDYGELDRASEVLGSAFMQFDPEKRPVVLYGHKSPLMYVGIFACMKSGRAYVPVDTVFPEGRLVDILDQLGGGVLVNATDEPLAEASSHAGRYLALANLEELLASDAAGELAREDELSGDDILYIMFTSGSTGKPKGVMMHAGSIDRFCTHFIDLLEARPTDVYFNRVPLSFDMTAGLATGGTLFAVEKAAEEGLRPTFEALRECHASQWVSTPSFIEACLADQSFCQEMMPDLRVITLAGEVLRNSTALRILEAFPEARLINAYGPTEAESVSEMDITREIAERFNPLPVGYMSPGMRAVIRNPETLEELGTDEVGEIYLAGCTVAKGYYQRPDLTQKAFSTYVDEEGEEVPCYKTGDKGYLDGEGRLFCLGRYDFQVKIGGFRIEIGDIEENLVALPDVAQACVVPVFRDGAVTHVCAFVQMADPEADTSFSQTRQLKGKLKAVLPDYMVPRAFRYLDELPTNANGKIDRKALGELAGSR